MPPIGTHWDASDRLNCEISKDMTPQGVVVNVCMYIKAMTQYL